MTLRAFGLLLAALLLLSACEIRRAGDPAASAPATDSFSVSLTSLDDEPLDSAALEAGRLDPGWKQFVPIDTTGQDTTSVRERVEDITPEAVNTAPTSLPLGGKGGGPSVLRVQVLLDRARFSPGVIDGRWGKNTEKAVYWLQRREGLRATGRVDEATFERLAQLAGNPDSLVVAYRLTDADVRGPFVDIPADIYEKAKMDSLGYESLSEKLGEMFHATPELLARLNPDVNLDSLRAGTTLLVPHVMNAPAPQGSVAEVVISDGAYYLHARDAQGRIVFHAPATLGASYDPSPSGAFEITSVTRNPWWHYQPKLLAAVPDDEPDARIPPGPNNAVGRVWIALSEPHYGIHGTSQPSTIGYVSSAGCVRLTNWDALHLAGRVQKGIPVRFVDTGKAGSARPDSSAARRDTARAVETI